MTADAVGETRRMGWNGERVEQVDTMSGFWVSGGGSAPGNLDEMEWKGRYLEITGQRAQSVGWIDHRGHCEPIANRLGM